MELKQYLQIVHKWLWLIGLSTFIAAGVSYGVSLVMPVTYEATTSLLIRAGGSIDDDYGTITANEHLATTYKELLTNRPILEETAIALNLSPAQTKALLAGNQVETWLIPDTSVIKLTVKNNNPDLAARIANEIVAVFIKTTREIGGTRGDVIVVEPAISPNQPVAPRKIINALVAAIGGGILATCLVFLLEYLDDSLKTPEEIQQVLSLPTLTTIPHVNHRPKQAHPQLLLTDPASLLTEAYYTLYVHLQLSNNNGHLNGRDSTLSTLLVTSPLEDREISSVALNLATVIAKAGLKVLLVEANLRRPQLHQLLSLSNESGLTDLLNGSADYLRCLQPTKVPNLSLILSGPPPFEPSLLLRSQQTNQLIESLKQQAEMVLFAAPPLLGAAETLVMAGHLDGTILVLAGRVRDRAAAAQAIERLHSIHAKVLGVVLAETKGNFFKFWSHERA